MDEEDEIQVIEVTQEQQNVTKSGDLESERPSQNEAVDTDENVAGDEDPT